MRNTRQNDRNYNAQYVLIAKNRVLAISEPHIKFYRLQSLKNSTSSSDYRLKYINFSPIAK